MAQCEWDQHVLTWMPPDCRPDVFACVKPGCGKRLTWEDVEALKKKLDKPTALG